MKITPILSTILTFLWSAVGQAGGVLFVDSYPAVTGITSRNFSTVNNTGFKTTFTDSKGRTETIESKFIVGVVEFFDEGEFPDITDAESLIPLQSKKSDVESVGAKLQDAKPYAQKVAASIATTIARFHSGERKVKGKWYTAAEYQKYASDLAAAEADVRIAKERRDADKRIEAERLTAEGKVIAALRASDQGAIEKQKRADGQLVAQTSETTLADPMARDEAIVNFKGRVQQVLGKVMLEPGLTKAVAGLADVAPLSRDVTREVTETADSARLFRRSVGYDAALHECAEETAVVDTLTAIEKSFREVHSMDPSMALQTVAAFAKDHPKCRFEGLKPAYAVLVNLQALCLRLQAEAKVHTDRAKAKAGTGKMSEAIKEYEQAGLIFPSSVTSRDLKEAREKTLGL